MNKSKLSPEEELKRTLAREAPSGRRRLIRHLVIWPLLLLVAFFIFMKWSGGENGVAMEYRTVEVERGGLTVTVTATGNLEPTNQVEVGSEISGTIASVTVDYNDFVQAGQVLARIDTTKLEAQLNQSRAALESARANLLQAKASLLEAENEKKRLIRVRELSRGKLPSVQDFDAAEATLKRARANEAMVLANIAEARARLKVDETNLEKAVIVSPINGVVLDRSIDPGQTVAASLQAPVLFTLAEDLTKMELHVDVDEADMGQVREGQQATFTVDAYPDRVFPARITQVRFGSQSSEGVVTYPAVLDVDNSDLSLRPGMTATADIVVKEVTDALLMPNAVLRFSPPEPEEKKGAGRAGGSLLSKLFPRPSREKQQRKIVVSGNKKQVVWALRDGKPVAVPVTIGATSGVMTEITGGELREGMPLILEAVNRGK